MSSVWVVMRNGPWRVFESKAEAEDATRGKTISEDNPLDIVEFVPAVQRTALARRAFDAGVASVFSSVSPDAAVLFERWWEAEQGE